MNVRVVTGRPTLLFGVALVAMACTGAPIVGAVTEPECDAAPACGRLDLAYALPAVGENSFAPLALPECTERDRFDPSTCADPLDPDSACGAGHSSCTRLAAGDSLRGGVMEGCAPEARLTIAGRVVLEDVEVACADLALHLVEGAELVIRGGRLDSTNLDVVGEAGSAVIFEGAEGDRVHLSLHGQAWLEVRERSRFANLRVVADDDMVGRLVSVFDSPLGAFHVRAGPRAELAFAGTSVDRGVLSAGQVVLGDATLRRVHLEAEDLIASGGAFIDAALDVEVGFVSGALMLTSRVTRCGALALFGTEVTRSTLEGCDTPLESHGTQFVRSALRGSTHLEGGSVVRSVFETGDGNANAFVNMSVMTSRFCDTPTVLASGGQMTCVACEPDIDSVMTEETAIVRSSCGSLRDTID